MEREARLARDRARRAGKRAAETSADREARLQKEAQKRASKKRQRLQEGCFALTEGGWGRETEEQSIDPAAAEETAGEALARQEQEPGEGVEPHNLQLGAQSSLMNPYETMREAATCRSASFHRGCDISSASS
eukprot:762961-Hanusia_phi.AAC.1